MNSSGSLKIQRSRFIMPVTRRAAHGRKKGQDNGAVYAELLGLSEKEINALAEREIM